MFISLVFLRTNRLVWLLDHNPGSRLLYTETGRRLRRFLTMLITSCARPYPYFHTRKSAVATNPKAFFFLKAFRFYFRSSKKLLSAYHDVAGQNTG